MADIQAACEALADAVQGMDGIRAKPYLDDQVNPPEVQVFTRAHDPRLTFTGTTRTVALGLRLFVPRTEPRSSQKKMRDWMDTTGDTSIVETIETEGNWPAGTNYVVVTQIGEPFEAVFDTGTYLAVDFDVDVTL